MPGFGIIENRLNVKDFDSPGVKSKEVNSPEISALPSAIIL